MTKRKTGSTKATSTTTNKGSASSTKKAAAKPTAKPAAAKAKASTAAKPKAAKTNKKSGNTEARITLEQRMMMIAEAAYYNALNSDSNGEDMQHWLQAEAQIDAMFHT